MSRSIIHVGMDVHKDTIMVAVFVDDAPKPELVKQLPNDLSKLRRFFGRLTRRGEVRACYEASGAGYGLHREITAWGVHSDVLAPSLIPTRPGQLRKYDRYDATQLGRLYRVGELTPIRIPSPAEERVRDLVRCRQCFQREILRSRRDDLDEQIEKIAFSASYKPLVQRLTCFRGISTLAAMTLVTEIGDWRRFERPSQLMAFLGLVPSEDSSVDRTRKGSITKAGNSRCRHVLVQAAWKYRYRPAVSAQLKKRQRGQPPQVIAHAWKAQHRLFKLFHRINAKKPSQVAAVATARELVGFLWAVMQDLEVQDAAQVRSAA